MLSTDTPLGRNTKTNEREVTWMTFLPEPLSFSIFFPDQIFHPRSKFFPFKVDPISKRKGMAENRKSGKTVVPCEKKCGKYTKCITSCLI